MKVNQQQQQLTRRAASHRLQAPDPSDLAWKQWGQALVEQYPRAEWPARLAQVPLIYHQLITRRLIRDFGYSVEA